MKIPIVLNNSACIGLIFLCLHPTYNELLSCHVDTVYGPRDVDSPPPLRQTGGGVREVYAGAGVTHDLFEVGAVPAHHEEMVLWGDLQLHTDHGTAL